MIVSAVFRLALTLKFTATEGIAVVGGSARRVAGPGVVGSRADCRRNCLAFRDVTERRDWTLSGVQPAIAAAHEEAPTQFLRFTHEPCDRHRDVATASMIENWIDESERRMWFLDEMRIAVRCPRCAIGVGPVGSGWTKKHRCPVVNHAIFAYARRKRILQAGDDAVEAAERSVNVVTANDLGAMGSWSCAR